MAEYTRAQWDADVENMRRIITQGAEKGMSRDDLRAVGEAYLAQRGITKEDLLRPPDYVDVPDPIMPPGGGRELINPTGARMTGGAIAAGLGLATPIPGDEFIAPALVAELFGLGAEKINELVGGVPETRSLPEQLTQTGQNIAYDVGLSGAGAGAERMVRQTVGGLPGSRINPATGTTGKDLAREATELGVSRGGLAPVVHGSQTMQRSFEAVRGMPGGGALDDAVRKTADDLERAFTDVLDDLPGNVRTPALVGKDAKAATRGFERSWRAGLEPRFKGLASHFGAGERIRMNNTLEALTGTADELARVPEIADAVVPGKFRAFAEGIKRNRGTLSFEELRTLRSYIGELLDDPTLQTDITKGELRRVYGAISEDLGNALAVKGPRAVQEWRRIDAMYRAGSERLDLLDSIVKSKTGAGAFDATFRGSDRGAEQLRALRSSIVKMEGGREVWDDLVKLKMHELGQPNPGNPKLGGYSIDTFLTRWGRLSDEAKDTMLGTGGLRDKLDKLVRVAAGSKELRSKVLNTSQTAHTSAWQRFLNGEWIRAGLQTTAGVVKGTAKAGMYVTGVPLLAPYTLSRLMRSEAFIDWLTEGTRLINSNPNALGAHLGRLAAVVKAQPELAEPVAQWVGAYASEVQRSYEEQGGAPERKPTVPESLEMIGKTLGIGGKKEWAPPDPRDPTLQR